MGASIYSELPDSLAIFSPSKAEELKRSLQLREATTTQSRRKTGSEGCIKAYWLIRSAAGALEFENRVSCHSLRKSFGYHV